MARQMSAEIELEEMTECSICTEAFTDPRGLPCIHTFCVNCLLNYGKDRQPGDTMPCPLCRKEFTIPDDGLVGLQKNFFMEKLLHVRQLSASKLSQNIPCDSCSNDKTVSDEGFKSAAMYCVQCQQNFCDQCSQIHAKIKAVADHALFEIGKPLQQEAIATKMPAPVCVVHENEAIKVYCLQCKEAICMMCFIKSHKNHDCCDIKEVSDDLRKQARSDAVKVTGDLKKSSELLPRLEKQKDDLTKHLAVVEAEINRMADELVDAVQRDRKKLLSEVDTIRKKRFKELETVKEELEQHMAALGSFKRYSETLLSSGTACDVAGSAKSLHDRAEELTKFDVIGYVETSTPPVTLQLLPASSAAFSSDAKTNLIGYISEDEKPKVTHVMFGVRPVGALASLGDDVYVVRVDMKYIAVYDAMTFTLRRRLPVPGLGADPYGLAVCSVNNCAYLSDYGNDSVHRVELSGSNAVMKWSVASKPWGLSVNSTQNVLVVSQDECKLQEFTTRGSLVREIQLQADIEYTHHAVQLSADKFLVSEASESQHRVCLGDAKGSVVRSFGGPPGSDLTKMGEPDGLAIDKHGNVLVAETTNHRLLVLDKSLSSAHEMSVYVDLQIAKSIEQEEEEDTEGEGEETGEQEEIWEDAEEDSQEDAEQEDQEEQIQEGGKLCGPCTLCYDESRRRLYVGEWDGGRVIVIDNLKDFSSPAV